jgi:hypothetical protein
MLSVSVQTLESFITPEITHWQTRFLERSMANMPFYTFTHRRRFRVRVKSIINVARCTRFKSRLSLAWCYPKELTVEGRVSRHDRKPGRQLPGASIAGESDRAHHRGGRREVGIKLPNAGCQCWVLASSHPRYGPYALLITVAARSTIPRAPARPRARHRLAGVANCQWDHTKLSTVGRAHSVDRRMVLPPSRLIGG